LLAVRWDTRRVITHEPDGYECPFCAVVAGRETDWNAQSDVVFRDEQTTAFVSVRNGGWLHPATPVMLE
jgi:histidine triad (HIT) family protein